MPGWPGRLHWTQRKPPNNTYDPYDHEAGPTAAQEPAP